MKLFGKDLDHDVAIVAEIGVNHEGDVEAASKLLRLAANAGVDAVKFQSYSPERYASASGPERLERVARFALDQSEHGRLAAEAKDLNVAFFSTPLSEDWVPFLSELCPAIKIASGDLTFEPVVRAAAKVGKPVILSTGLGTIEEIDQAVRWIAEEAGERTLADRLVLMQCVSAYPTPIEETNVRTVPFLAERYGVPVGYSNHAIGIDACIAAIALGAQVIEAHFTDQSSGRSFRDHELSLEPSDMEMLVRLAPRIRASLGKAGKTRAQSELQALAATRKGVVAARDLAEGTVLKREDLAFARPASEFAASEISKLVDASLTTSLKQGELVPRWGVNIG